MECPTSASPRDWVSRQPPSSSGPRTSSSRPLRLKRTCADGPARSTPSASVAPPRAGPRAAESADAYVKRRAGPPPVLTDSLGIDRETILLSLNVYTNNGLSIGEIEAYWLDLLELPPTSVRKHTLNHMPTSSSGRAKNKLPYGVCTLRLHSTRMLQHIYGAIQEYGGFDEPAWLR
jgi:hypothetical protein